MPDRTSSSHRPARSRAILRLFRSLRAWRPLADARGSGQGPLADARGSGTGGASGPLAGARGSVTRGVCGPLAWTHGLCVGIGLIGACLIAGDAWGGGEQVMLTQQATRLLATRCGSCHGAGRTSGLDLRTRESRLRGGTRGPAIVPGDPDRSPLLRFVTGREGKVMPAAGPLPVAEQHLLRRWIAGGADGTAAPRSPAPQKTHWALRPLQSPPVPVVRGTAGRNPVDAFIREQLAARGLRPAPPAEPRDLIRRLSYDLRGLPPTPEEVEAYVSDRSSGAYERLVDRYLASPQYGERWARHWLDVVRFAESQGYERDKLREHAWRYRDYVIQALNRDIPYPQFIREQIAGDVLPNAGEESIAATGFLVAGPFDEVGNAQASQVMRARVREDELEDMVGAVAQTFLGLTVNCARCHDHKFDPIPQKDYFRMQAALAGVRHGNRSLATPAQLEQLTFSAHVARQRVVELEDRLAELDRAARRRVVQRPTGDRAVGRAPQPFARWTFEQDGADAEGLLPLQVFGGARIRHGRLILDGKDSFAHSAPLPADLKARTLEVWLDPATLDQRGGGVVGVESQDGQAFDSLTFAERQPRKWIAGSEGFRRTQDLEAPDEDRGPGSLTHLAVVYEETGRITLYRNGRVYGSPYSPPGAPLRTFPARESRLLFGLRHSAAARPGSNAWWSGELEEVRLYDRALSREEVLASLSAGPALVTPADMEAARTPDEIAGRAALTPQVQAARAERDRINTLPMAYAVNSAQPGPVRVLARGDVNQAGPEVTAGGLSCVPGPSADFGLAADAPEGERRLRLADWIAHPANPLTPRVIVNRVWQYHFGRGLAGSPSDFGVNGEPPTHPALLDWLASTFAANPSLKRLHRLIVTSATYRQSVAFDENAARVDAENRLLWRTSPRRLDAETLRDAMLAVSGELNPKVEGPGFLPFRVVVANTHFYHYEDRTEPEYNRRSIYRTVINSGKIPLLDAFDCPDPSVKTPRRGSTITPMQALELLNSSFSLRQAARLAERCAREGGADPAGRIDRAYRLALGRPPRAEEGSRALAFVREHGLPAFCRVLLNSSEFLYTR